MSIAANGPIVDGLERLYDILMEMPVHRKASSYDNRVAQRFVGLIQWYCWSDDEIKRTHLIHEKVAAIEARFRDMQKLGAFSRWFGSSQTESSVSSLIEYCKMKLALSRENPQRWNLHVGPSTHRAMSALLRRRLEI